MHRTVSVTVGNGEGYRGDLRARGIAAAHLSGLEAMQQELFYRNTGPGIDNRLVQFTGDGVRLIEFTCGNFGYRDHDAGDYMVACVTNVRFKED